MSNHCIIYHADSVMVDISDIQSLTTYMQRTIIMAGFPSQLAFVGID